MKATAQSCCAINRLARACLATKLVVYATCHIDRCPRTQLLTSREGGTRFDTCKNHPLPLGRPLGAF